MHFTRRNDRICELLIRARMARGWSQTEIARRIQTRSRELGRPLRTGRDGVCHWERGREPDRPTRLVIADVLGIPAALVDEKPWPQWLAADPMQQPVPKPWTFLGAVTSLTELTGSTTVDATRREIVLIAGGTLTATLLDWMTADPVAAGQMTTGQRIGEATVVRIEERAAVLRKTDDADGGAVVLTETADTLALASGLLRGRSYSEHHRTRLLAAVSDLARQRAAAMLDIHGICADAAFDTALRTAHAAGDTALGANVLNFWAVSAYNTGRYTDAEAMASTGLAAVRGRSTPRIEAMLTSRRGRARAHLGDSRCWDDFQRAQILMSQAGGHEDPPWGYWFDEAEVFGAKASSHHDMDQPGLAATAFGQVHALIDPAQVRTRALYATRRADALLAQGEIEHACAVAHRALGLTESISSHRATGPLRDLARRLVVHERTPAVRDFRDRARLVLPTV